VWVAPTGQRLRLRSRFSCTRRPNAAEAPAVTVEDAYRPASLGVGFRGDQALALAGERGRRIAGLDGRVAGTEQGDAMPTSGPLTTIAACEDAAALMGNEPHRPIPPVSHIQAGPAGIASSRPL